MPMALPAESPLSQASIALRWLARVRRTPLLCTQLTRVSLLTSTPMYRGVARVVCIRVSPRAKVCGLGWATCRRYLAVQIGGQGVGRYAARFLIDATWHVGGGNLRQSVHHDDGRKEGEPLHPGAS